MSDRSMSAVAGGHPGYSGRAEATLPHAQHASYAIRRRPEGSTDNSFLPEMTVREMTPAGAGQTSNKTDRLRLPAAGMEASQEPGGMSKTNGILRTTARKRDSTGLGDDVHQHSATNSLRRPVSGPKASELDPEMSC